MFINASCSANRTKATQVLTSTLWMTGRCCIAKQKNGLPLACLGLGAFTARRFCHGTVPFIHPAQGVDSDDGLGGILSTGCFFGEGQECRTVILFPKKKIYKHTRELDQLLLGHGLPGQVLKKNYFD